MVQKLLFYPGFYNNETSLLFRAARKGFYEVVEILLQIVCPNNTDPKGCTPLMITHDTRIAKLLISVTDCNMQTSKCGLTALSYTILHGRPNIATLLIPVTNCNLADVYGRTPLMNAINKGYRLTCRYRKKINTLYKC